MPSSPDKRKIQNAERSKQLRYNLWMYYKAHPCVDCGESRPEVLELDHVRGEKFNDISTMITRRYAWTTILSEIAKCEVRCANCHRLRTARTFGWYEGLL